MALSFWAALPLGGFEPERADRLRGQAAGCSAPSEPIGLSPLERLPLYPPTAQSSDPAIDISPLPCPADPAPGEWPELPERFWLYASNKPAETGPKGRISFVVSYPEPGEVEGLSGSRD